MSFQPSALDERTLKSFVGRLLSQLREQNYQPKPTRASCQEMVARMLGFAHWHAAISAVKKGKAISGSVVSAPESLDEYPDYPDRFDLKSAIQAIRWAHEHGATDVVATLDTPLALVFRGKWMKMSPRPLSKEELDVFAQAFWAHAQGLLPRQAFLADPFSFFENTVPLDPSVPQKGRIRVSKVSVTKDGETFIESHFRFIPAARPSLGEHLPEGLKKKILTPGGSVLVSGGTVSGRTSFLSALALEVASSPNAQVKFIGELEEILLGNYSIHNDSTLVQLSGDLDNRLNALAAHSTPCTIVLDRALTTGHVEQCLKASDWGHRVYMGQHAETVPDALTRPLRGWDDWRERLPAWLDTWGLVTAIRLCVDEQGRLTRLYEWLELTPEVRSKIQDLAKKSLTPVHLRGLMVQVLIDHGHSFHADAVRLFNQGVVPKSVVDQMKREHRHRLAEPEYM